MFCPGSEPSLQVASAGAAFTMERPAEIAAASAALSCGCTRGALLGAGTKVSCRTASNNNANGKTLRFVKAFLDRCPRARHGAAQHMRKGHCSFRRQPLKT